MKAYNFNFTIFENKIFLFNAFDNLSNNTFENLMSIYIKTFILTYMTSCDHLRDITEF